MSDIPNVHFGTIVSGSKITSANLGKDEPQWSEAALNPPLTLRPYPYLDEALKTGNYRLHAFRSGGGLRVVYLADPGEGSCSSCDKAYGEHPNIEPALQLAEIDCAAGRRPYHEVYGKLTPHFYTGNTENSSFLDAWTRAGHSWDINWEGTEYSFTSEYYHQHTPPKHIRDEVTNSYKELVKLEEEYKKCKPDECNALMERMMELNRKTKVTYVTNDTGKDVTIEVKPWVAASGEIGTTYRTVDKPKDDSDPFWFEKTMWIIGGTTLMEHLQIVEAKLAEYYRTMNDEEE